MLITYNVPGEGKWDEHRLPLYVLIHITVVHPPTQKLNNEKQTQTNKQTNKQKFNDCGVIELDMASELYSIERFGHVDRIFELKKKEVVYHT